MRLSSILPACFLRTPPHCLKKKGMFLLLHSERIPFTQFSDMGREPGPDSPPTITQCSPFLGKFVMGVSNGSIETKRTVAGTVARSFSLCLYLSDSTVTPIHTLLGQSSFEASSARRSERLVTIWKVQHLILMTFQCKLIITSK